MDAFPGYTRFDHSKKVFFDFVIIENATTASDGNNDLHRGQTWHGGESYSNLETGSGLDNHDN